MRDPSSGYGTRRAALRVTIDQTMLALIYALTLCTPAESAGTPSTDPTVDGGADQAETQIETQAEPSAEGVEPPSLDPTMLDAAAEEPTGEAGLDPSMLDEAPAEPVDPRAAVATSPAEQPSSALSPEQLAEAVDEAYARMYRPDENPVRLNMTARALFANVGGNDSVNGRVGGASIDLGPTWNFVAVAVTLRGLAGQVRFDPQTTLTSMVGGGPTVGLGRLALLGRGFVDLRLGYDVHYATMRDGTARAPHGPRARVDLGLLLTGQRRWFHGVGVSLGYQRLVGSFGADLPAANLLTIGVSYWLG